MKKQLIQITILLLFPLFVNAQINIMKHFSTKDGLASSEVYQVYQDTKGYIWFATNFGPSRYDGYNFVNYYIDDEIKDNTTLSIYEDKKGRVWFTSLNCTLNYFYNDSIYNYKYNNNIIKYLGRSYLPIKDCLHIDEHDNIYFGIDGKGIIKINPDGEISTINKTKKNLAIFSDNQAVIRYISNNKDSLTINTDRIHTYVTGLSSIKIKHIATSYILKHPNKEEYFISSGNIILHIKNNKVEKTYRYKNRINYFGIDKKKNLWVAYAQNGIEKYPNADLLSKPKSYLPNKSISSYYIDRENGIWFTTLHSGVYYLPNEEITSYKEEYGLPFKVVNTIERNNDDLLIGSNQPRLFVIKNFFNSKTNNLVSYPIPAHKNDVINTIKKNGDKLIIGMSLSLYSLNSKYQNIEKINDTINNKHTDLNAISVDFTNKGKLCIGNSSGALTQTNNHNETYTFNRKIRIRTNKILYDNSRDCIWLGTIFGLYQYKNDSIIFYGDKNNMLKNRIIDIQLDPNNKLWLATKGAGVIVFDEKGINTINKQKGLSSNSTTSIQIIDSIAWVGTNRGINKIKIDKNNNHIHISHFSSYDGLVSNEISHLKSINSTLFTLSNEGFSFFNTKKLSKDLFNKKIIIQEIRIGNSVYHDINNRHLIDYRKNSVGFKYSPLKYKEDGSTYKYRIKNLSDEWNYTHKNELFFPYLPSGDYEFQIVLKLNDGTWSKKITSHNFTVTTPVTDSLIFKLIILLLFILITSTFIFFVIRYNRNQQKANQNIMKYQQIALGAQMNPHFLFNSLNSIHRYVLESNPLQASRYLNRFARLMRKFLENSQHSSTLISDETETIDLYLSLERLRMKSNFDYSIFVAEDIDPTKQTIPSLLLQPIVENAIMHGIRYLRYHQGKVDIKIYTENNTITCSIQDNGVGRKATAEIEKKSKHTSYGDSIIQKRINLLNKINNTDIKKIYIDLVDDNNTAIGTQVLIKNIPKIF